MALNFVREKEKPRRKLSYKIFKELDGYTPLLDISQFVTLLKLAHFHAGTKNCVVVVCNSTFDSNNLFVLLLTHENQYY